MKTTILITSQREKLHPEVEKAISALDCPVLLHVEERHRYCVEDEKNRCINIAKGRNRVRALALRTNASGFLFLDDDVVPPPNTVSQLSSHLPFLKVVGGWFPCHGGREWVGGRFYAPGCFALFKSPQPSTTPTDLISMGCAFMAREVLEKIYFHPGTDRFCRLENGVVVHIADSGDFSWKLSRLGLRAYLDGSVVCKHLNREEYEAYE